MLEVISNYRGDTFRTVYTVRWPNGIYVLHVFQKKSKSGIKTPKAEMNLIESRLGRLKEFHDEAMKRAKGTRS